MKDLKARGRVSTASATRHTGASNAHDRRDRTSPRGPAQHRTESDDTELDINLLPSAGRGADPAVANPYANGLPDEKQQQLARRYADIFGLIVKHRTGSRASPSGV